MSVKNRFYLGTALAIAVAAASQNSLAADPRPLPTDAPAEKTVGQLEQVFTFHDAMPTGVTVTENGRIFVNYPKLGRRRAVHGR